MSCQQCPHHRSQSTGYASHGRPQSFLQGWGWVKSMDHISIFCASLYQQEEEGYSHDVDVSSSLGLG